MQRSVKFPGKFGLLMLGALLLPATVCAHPPSSSSAVGGGNYSLSVEDEWGRSLPTFHHHGQTYVQGALGARYVLRVRNHSAVRVEAVMTVDGRDVISGAEGDYTRERGYLIDPYGEVTVEGFRRSHSEVAAFRFSTPGGSYSARMGTPENVGVIGVAIFPERARPRAPIATAPRPRTPYYEAPTSDARREARSKAGAARSSGSADSLGTAGPAAEAEASYGRSAPHAPTTRAPAPRDNLGTEYGESLGSAAREVAFVRANATRPAALLSVRYDDHEGLAARGIPVYPRRPVAHATPSPFPHNRFAPPPP